MNADALPGFDDRLHVRALTRGDFPAIEQLFGQRGACGGCWCMLWRVPSTGAYWTAHKGDANRLSFKALVETGVAQGCLAFDGDSPVGWCAFGPKNDFAYFSRSRSLPKTATQGIYAVTCFFIASRHRRQGLAGQLLNAAVRLARERGARSIEGYPSIAAANGVLPAAFAHTGVPQLFARAGFERVADAGARAVYRLQLQPETD